MGVDACLIALAYYLAFVLRFDAGIPGRYEDLLVETVGFVVLMKLCLFAAFGLYSKLWRFVDQADFESIVKAVVVVELRADRRCSSCSRRPPPTRRVA